MNALGNAPLTSLKTLAVTAVLAILSLLTGASLLACPAPSRCPGRVRRWLGRVVILLTSTLLIASVGALVFNRSFGFMKTSGDLAKLALLSVVGTTAQFGGEASINAQSAAVFELDTTSTKTEDGMSQITWTGPSSGIAQPVFVTTPRDYSLNDGKTYAVIELLHGHPGGPDGTMQGAQVQEAPSNAIDEGIIPLTIVVGPSFDVDEEAHDCADIEGCPAVYTWVSHDVPAMIRHNFPNTTSHQDVWMVGGFSAGAYYAIWMILCTPETHGAAASLSGYGTQVEGQMANQGEQYLADNMLSTMLANRTSDGMRIYAMVAGDDAVGGVYITLKMVSAVKEPDSVTTDVPPSGGHAGSLQREHIPTMLAWWGSSDRASRTVGTVSTTATAQSSEAGASIVPVTTVTHEVRPTAPNGYLTLTSLIAGVLVSLTLTWFVAPRWQPCRHEDDIDDHASHRHRTRRRVQRSGLFTFVPRPALRVLGYLARLMSLGTAMVGAVLLVGVAANTADGFYILWSPITQSSMDGPR